MKSLILAAALAFGPYDHVQVLKVKDGDTVRVAVETWPGTVQVTNLRITGVNTPEKRTRSRCEKKAGYEATLFTEKFLAGKTVRIPEIFPGDTKFAGRMNGRLEADGVDLGEALINAGHARPYSGEKRGPWCDDG